MSYVKTKDGSVVTYPYSIDQFRKDNRYISFPRIIDETLLASYEVFPVTFMEIPVFDTLTQKISQDQEPALVNGKWQIGYSIIDKTSEEIQLYNESIASRARAKRNALLFETDFYALNDVTMTPEMATYRQELRDITNQAGFPETINWPVKPA